MSKVAETPPEIAELRERLGKTFPAVDAVFNEYANEAIRLLSPEGVQDWLDGAKFLGKLGRGAEPMLVFLDKAPQVAAIIGEEAVGKLKDFAWQISRTPNGDAIVPFLQTAAAAARRLEGIGLFGDYLQLADYVMQETTTSVHGIVATHPSPSFVDFLNSVPSLLDRLSIAALKNWAEYGVKAYRNDPEGQSNYFALQSVDAHTMLQRERHGTLLVDHERLFHLYLTGLWETDMICHPYSLLFDEIRKPRPYLDKNGIHLPDVYDDQDGVPGIDRYRALLAHVAAHQRWTTPILGDNLSPFQHVAAEIFEDVRIEWLAIQTWPGLRRLWLSLHPKPAEGACPEGWCGVYHRLSMFSRAILDPEHSYQDTVLNEFIGRFHTMMEEGGSTTQDAADMAVQWYVKSRKDSDMSTDMFLDDVEIEYRDDNRHMWLYQEQGDEDYMPESQSESEPEDQDFERPMRHYDEWDYGTQAYRPDWVSLSEHLHPSGSAALIDQLLAKHMQVVKRLERMLDMLKPQNKVRIRFQEDGTDLDLDIALRSLIDYKAGSQPDPRINMSHRTDGRSIAVSLLLDLSVSLNEKPEGCNQTILELSQEAASLLAWAVDRMDDPFAIGGFHSNSRHEVRYFHLKGYSESWGDEVKARIAAMQGAFSTRMGAALRHAGQGLKQQQADKKLLLILTDGRPHDVDVKDEQYLIADARKAVQELDQDGIYTWCINLDPKADEYVTDIFGPQYTVIDNIERLPERLPELFISLTK
ncbi:MAG: hypothetical protein Q9M24_02365 [Mariprofundaceae bacterium]|nr:hypothetical protein [Mariprofundaceae bacterium]